MDLDKIWFSSDFHGYHTNLTKGVSKWEDKNRCRDFSNALEMTEAVVESVNTTVPKDGTLFHLGDWSFGGYQNIEKLRRQINCQNIYHCYGNHDHHIEKNPALQSFFKECFHYKELRIGKKLVVLSHYSFRVWRESHRGSYSLYGHSHGSLPPLGRSLDVGWDVWKKPISWLEIDALLKQISPHFIDHHIESTNL